MRAVSLHTLRKGLPLALLLTAVTLAWMLSAKTGGWLFAPIQWLGQYEGFHLIGHWAIFGGIAWLARSQGRARTWGYVLGGGLLLEIAQVMGGGWAANADTVRSALFDLGMDAAGALAVPVLLRRAYGRRNKNSAKTAVES